MNCIDRFSVDDAVAAEASLYQRLFESYNKNIRPARRLGDTVRVRIGLTLKQIIDIDERTDVSWGITHCPSLSSEKTLVSAGFSYRQGGVRIFDAGVKILMSGCQI